MKKTAAVIVLFSLVLSGCGLFKKAPQEAVNEAVKNFAEAEKMSSNLTLKGTVQNPSGESPSRITFTAGMAGKGDTSNKEEARFETTVKLDLSIDGNRGSGEAVIRAVGKKLYIKLIDLKLPGANESLGQELGSLFNSWWEVPTGEKASVAALTEQQRKVKEKLKNMVIFTNAAEEGEEDVAGETSTKYRVELNKEAVKDLIVDVARLGSTGGPSGPSPADEQAIAESLKDIEFSGIVSVNGEDVLNRIRGTLTISPKQGATSSFEVDYIASDFGAAVDLAAPEGARELNPLLMSAFFLGSLSSQGAGTSSPVIAE